MPGNIAEFNSPINTITPSEHGADTLAQAGRHIGSEYQQIGQDYKHTIDAVGGPIANIIDQHDTMADISQGAHALAAGTNNLQTQWNETVQKSDPNDKSIQGSFLNNNLEPFLDQFQSSFTTEKGQQWALQRADELRSHFTTTTSADMSTRAGDAVILNTVGQLNQLKSSAYKDPSSMDIGIKQVDDYYNAAKENSTGLLSAEQIAHIDVARQDAKNEIVKNAIKGYADSNDPKGPANAQTILNGGKFDKYLNGDEQITMQKYIDNQVGAREVEAKQKQQAQLSKQVEQNTQQINDIFSQLSSGKMVPATQVFANPNITTQQKNNMVGKDGLLSMPLNFLTSPEYGSGFSSAAKVTYSGQPLTPDQITAAVKSQQLTPAGAQQLQSIADKMKTPEGLAESKAQQQVLQQMRSQIVKGGPNSNDPEGEKLYNSAMNNFYPTWDAQIKSGKTVAQLSDPNSKDYIGTMASLYKRSDTQALADVTNAPQKPVGLLPPVEKRVVGKAYTNPNGATRYWTGDGWSKSTPASQNPDVPLPE